MSDIGSFPASPTPAPPSDDQSRLITVGPCVNEAQILVNQIRANFSNKTNQQLLDAFTALADGDKTIGYLAYYLWRWKLRRWR